jgi:hypothetical protein
LESGFLIRIQVVSQATGRCSQGSRVLLVTLHIRIRRIRRYTAILSTTGPGTWGLMTLAVIVGTG